MPFYIVEREREWERQFEQETLELSEAIKTTNTAFIFWFLSGKSKLIFYIPVSSNNYWDSQYNYLHWEWGIYVHFPHRHPATCLTTAEIHFWGQIALQW